MKITVNKDNVKIEEFDIVHEGEHRVNKCSFSFSEEYTDDLVKKAIFTSQNSSIEVAIIDNECDIPTEILKARNIVLLGVYAYKVVADKLDLRYSPSPDAFKINSGSYIEGASESEEITSSQFEQYMQALNDGLNKVEESIKKMDEATSSATQLVDDINQKLENGDFIGPEGTQGVQGVPGKDGVGITTITSGQSSVEADKTITPITVNKTDGSSQIFKVEAKNGLDGQNGKDGKDGVNGQDGLTPTIGENGNWFLGDTDTGKPSRGEVGPSPDLSNYVKNTDYATNNKTGVINGNINGFQVSSSGNPYAKEYTAEEYDNVGNQDFIGKGTLENAKDKIVGSSIPVKNLNNSLRDLTPKQDAKGTDNTFNDGLDMKLDDLAGYGKSEQIVTTGKNKLDYTYLSLNEEQSTLNGGSYTYENGLLEIDATNATNNMTIRSSNISNSEFVLKAGTYYAHVCINTKKVSDGTFTQYMAGQITLAEDVYINQWFVPCPKGTKENTILMIEPGNEKTEWEPYTGGQPSLSPDYPQEINSIEGSVEFACRGKSLLNATKEEYTTNGLTVSFDNSNMYINGIANQNSKYIGTPYKLGKGTYTLSLNILRGNIESSNTGAIFYLYEGTSYTTLNKSILLKTNTKGYSTFTLEKETNVSLGLFARTTETFNNVVLQYQVTKGENPDYNFEPCVQPNEVTFNLNDEKLRSVGDVKDELVVDLDTGDYYKVENVGEIIFDGSDDEIIVKRSDVTIPNASCFRVENFDYTLIRDLIGMCNYFRYDTEKRNIKDTFRFIKSPGYAIQFCIEDNFASNPDEFRTWLSTHNTIVDYILQKPTTKKLGTLSAEDLAKLKTFKGYNNVTINTNLGLMNIRFTYGLDIKKYVDNKIAQLSEQLIKGE